MTRSESHRRVLAPVVTEHLDQLEAYEDSEKETAHLAKVLLEWARADGVLDEVQTE